MVDQSLYSQSHSYKPSYDVTGRGTYGPAWGFYKVGMSGSNPTTACYVSFMSGQKFGVYSRTGDIQLNVNTVDVLVLYFQ